MSKKVAFYTLGCKLNYAETATITRIFLERGFNVVDFSADADMIVINTCTVTENADREARKIIRRALRLSPHAYVVVVGCYPQVYPDEVASIKGVSLVLGTQEKFRIFDYLDFDKIAGDQKIFVGEIADMDDFGPANSAEESERTRAFLKIQDGCDYNCSFCTIPLARGSSRSYSVDNTISDAKKLLECGFKEIVLSGVNIGDYGRKFNLSFYELLQEIIKIQGDFRVRISSIEPNLLSDEIIELAYSSTKICSHFHIPLQSGSAEMLKRMRRRYDLDLFTNRIEKIRETIPNCAVGIDVIVGFPGETESLFEKTHAYLLNLPFSYLHVFSFSERKGTYAQTLNGSVPHTERAIRSRMLRTLSEKKRRAFYESQIGSVRPVLFESKERKGNCEGFTDNYVRVGVPYESMLENQLRTVRLNGIDGKTVSGVLVDEKASKLLPCITM